MSGSFLWSGSGEWNDSSSSFSCRTSNLSSEAISNHTYWQIASQNHVGAIIAGCLILLFFVVGFIWNMFIIVTFLVKHHLLKEPGNIFLFNVALTDASLCLTTMTFAYVVAFSGEFIFGNSDVIRCVMCKVSGFFLSFLVLVTLHLLCALSVDRFIVLSKPLRYKHIMSCRKAVVVCIFIYCLCFFLTVLPQADLLGEIEFNVRFGCVPRFSPTANLYYIIAVGVEMCIPSFVLALTNVWTFRIVSQFLKRNLKRKSAYPKNKEKKKEEHSKHQSQQAQLVKVFGAMFIAFVFSYTPTIILGFLAFILNYASDGRVVPPPEVYTFAYVCFLSNPVSHPIIESSFVKDLRYEVTRVKSRIRRVGSTAYHKTTQFVLPSSNSGSKSSASITSKSRSNSVTLDNRPVLEPASRGFVSAAKKKRAFSLVDDPHRGSMLPDTILHNGVDDPDRGSMFPDTILHNGVQDSLFPISEESHESSVKFL